MEIGNNMNILVTYAGVYDIPAENGREAAKGCLVHYFFYGENGEGLYPRYEDMIDVPVGFQRNKVALDYGFKAKIPVAPAVYNGLFAMQTGSDGKPVMKLKDLVLVAPINPITMQQEPAKKESK